MCSSALFFCTGVLASGCTTATVSICGTMGVLKGIKTHISGESFVSGSRVLWYCSTKTPKTSVLSSLDADLFDASKSLIDILSVRYVRFKT